MGEAEPDEIGTWLDSLPEEKRDKALSEYTRRAEQRGADIARQEAEAQQSRQVADDELVQRDQNTETMLHRSLLKGGYLDQTFDQLAPLVREIDDDDLRAKLERHLNSVEALVFHPDFQRAVTEFGKGKEQLGARQAVSTVRETLNDYLPLLSDENLTPTESKELAAAAADYRRTGSPKLIKTMFALTVNKIRADERTKIESESLEKARKELGLLEKIEKLQGLRVAPLVDGKTAPGVMTVAAFEALPMVDQMNTPPAERRRIYEAGRAG